VKSILSRFLLALLQAIDYSACKRVDAVRHCVATGLPHPYWTISSSESDDISVRSSGNS
jgi:hypothetical protein